MHEEPAKAKDPKAAVAKVAPAKAAVAKKAEDPKAAEAKKSEKKPESGPFKASDKTFEDLPDINGGFQAGEHF